MKFQETIKLYEEEIFKQASADEVDIRLKKYNSESKKHVERLINGKVEIGDYFIMKSKLGQTWSYKIYNVNDINITLEQFIKYLHANVPMFDANKFTGINDI